MPEIKIAEIATGSAELALRTLPTTSTLLLTERIF